MSSTEKAPADAVDGGNRRRVIVTPARVALYLHLAIVVMCSAFSRLDGCGELPGYGPAGLAVGALLWLAHLAWFACPLTVIVAFARQPSRMASYVIAVEVCLAFLQFIALLPMVQ